MLITFEGPDGAGKSTAIAAIAERLREMGYDVLATREPGAGDVGEQIRDMLLEGPDLDERSELLLFLADRANHVATIIRPAIEAGKVVLCDRFVDSTVVYQGFAGGLDQEFIRTANDFATGGLMPDFTILFDLDPQVGLSRLNSPDKLDSRPLEYYNRVRAGFLREAHAEPRRFIVIDASRPRDIVLSSVVLVVTERLQGQKSA